MKKRIAVYIGQTISKSISLCCISCSSKVFNEMLDLALQYSDDQLEKLCIDQPPVDAVIDDSILRRIVSRTVNIKELVIGNLQNRT